jgi:hypothetical protein
MIWHPFSRWHLDPPYDDEADDTPEDWEDDVPDHWWAEGGWADPNEIAFLNAAGDA